LPATLVDTGSEYTWAPARVLEGLGIERKKRISFSMANGQTVTRDVGFAIVRAGGTFTVDEVVFGEPGDLVLLGARSLEGLNLKVDTGRRPRLRAQRGRELPRRERDRAHVRHGEVEDESGGRPPPGSKTWLLSSSRLVLSERARPPEAAGARERSSRRRRTT
jgi:predicted aspartyl protease